MIVMSAKILIIDDEPDIRILIKYTLEKEGFLVDTAENGEEGIIKAKQFLPDLIILDVMMPGMDGMETCEKLRLDSSFNNTFICFLTARSEDYSQIAGFNSGADDYITKPVKPKVLVSRINGILRRKVKSTEPQNESIKHTEGLVIDRDKFLVYVNGQELNLPKKEFNLLTLLADKNLFGWFWEHPSYNTTLLDKCRSPIFTHPITKDTMINLSVNIIDKIHNDTKGLYSSVIEKLKQHSPEIEDEFAEVLNWETGDFVLWDNCQVIHTRPNWHHLVNSSQDPEREFWRVNMIKPL